MICFIILVFCRLTLFQIMCVIEVAVTAVMVTEVVLIEVLVVEVVVIEVVHELVIRVAEGNVRAAP